MVFHENGMGDGMAKKKEEKMTVLGVDASVQAKPQTYGTESMTWDKSIDQKEKAMRKEILVTTVEVNNGPLGHMGLETEVGLLAMVFDETMGWTEEKLGQNSRHWKRLAREVKKELKGEEKGPKSLKHEGQTPLSDLDPKALDTKCKKDGRTEGKQISRSSSDDTVMVGGGCEAASPSLMTILAWNCRGIGSALVVRNLADKVRSKDPLLVFLTETKTGESKMKGIRNKLEYTQGTSIPSDGQSGGLTMMWKEGSDIRLRSCSHSHTDVEVHSSSAPIPWRATGFYGHPNSGKRFIS